MSKILLNFTHREQLVTLAVDKIKCPHEQDLMTYKRDRMLKILENELEIRLPRTVLDVLEDFDLLTTTREVRVAFEPGNDTMHYFPYSAVTIYTIGEVRFPKQIDPYGIKRVLVSPFNGTLHKAHGSFLNAERNHTVALKTRLLDYEALINSATYFEDVADVWEEANEIRDELEISPESLRSSIQPSDRAIAAIRADVNSRQRELQKNA